MAGADPPFRANEGGPEQRPDARDNRESRSLCCRLSGLGVTQASASLDRRLTLQHQANHRQAPIARVGAAAQTRPGVGAGPGHGTVAVSARSLRRIWPRGAALPGRRNRLTPRPCRSDPDRSPVCPHPGPAVPGGLAPLRLQVRFEEREDAPACIARGFLVVARSWREYSEDRLQDGERERRLVSGSFVVVEKGVPGLRVLLDIVLDPDCRQCPVEAIGGPPQCTILAAVASHDRASPLSGSWPCRRPSERCRS